MPKSSKRQIQHKAQTAIDRYMRHKTRLISNRFKNRDKMIIFDLENTLTAYKETHGISPACLGIPETLANLKRKGYRLALVTLATTSLMRRTLTGLGIEESLFDAIKTPDGMADTLMAPQDRIVPPGKTVREALKMTWEHYKDKGRDIWELAAEGQKLEELLSEAAINVIGDKHTLKIAAFQQLFKELNIKPENTVSIGDHSDETSEMIPHFPGIKAIRVQSTEYANRNVLITPIRRVAITAEWLLGARQLKGKWAREMFVDIYGSNLHSHDHIPLERFFDKEGKSFGSEIAPQNLKNIVIYIPSTRNRKYFLKMLELKLLDFTDLFLKQQAAMSKERYIDELVKELTENPKK
jgi:phosphoglycolate phosphatase-like HAD superfamily hydrolase